MIKRVIASAAPACVLVLTFALAGAASPAVDPEMGVSFDRGGTRDIEETIWFQGYLADDATGDPVNATYDVQARIYSDAIGGVSLWGPETHTDTDIADGWFNIELGSVIGSLPAFDTPPYYLQLIINGETLDPRLKMASVPSAFQSMGADNGLNLPYAGTWDSSGHAFQVTNTGPNICGYFVINNPGSSAGAVYGKHNGSGSAVFGYHTGTGAAVKGVAAGSGYAGVFEGPVSITDSLSVEGTLHGQGAFFEHSVVTAGTLACSGVWIAEGAREGYVLRCADDWGFGEWGPPVIMATANSGQTVDIGTDPTAYTDAEVTLEVPGDGYVVVEANAWIHISHTQGTNDKVYLGISDSPTSFYDFYSRTTHEVPSTWPTDTQIDQTFYVHNTFPVAEGTHTFYLVGEMLNGQDAGDEFWYCHMRAVYYPYPLIRSGTDWAEPVKNKEELGR
jgi:hypothetical protein